MSGQFTISKVWGERFHRRSSKINSPTKDWIFYISRPTLERLRKPDKDGTSVRLLRNLVKEFLNKKEHTSSADFQGSFSIETKPHNGQYSTFCYPFDINDEIDDKLGVLIHLGEDNENNVKQGSVTFEEFENYPTMFDKNSEEAITRKLGGESNNHPNPPGVSNSDPMWMEFSASKILPADQLIDGEDEGFDHGPFRSIISHQYIEVRLVRSRILGKNAHNYNREQLDAISAYESLNSGFSNFAGPPGTGKSTILHMVCAHHIFLNFIKGEQLRDNEKRILYYVPSPVLKEEARREIKSILVNIYQPAIKALNTEIDTKALVDLSFIEFVSQEDLFIITGHTKLDSEYNILREASNEKLENQLQMKWSEDERKKEINLIKKGLRNVQFGLLGGKRPRRFTELGTNKGIDLFKPLQEDGLGKFSPNHLLSLKKFITNEKESDASKKILKKLTVAIENLRSDNKLYNGQDSQFWDPAIVIQHSLDLEHSEKSIWGKLEKSIDFVVIDEVQDISITEIRILLTHFASRAEGQELRPFRLVCAGDENQNVNHLLFTEQNEHVRFLYLDWVLSLQHSVEKSIEGYKLSHNLGPSSEKNLVSGYRVFNEMIPYVNKVLKRLRKFHAPAQTQSEKTRISKSELKPTPFGRNGVCITLGNKIKDRDKNLIKKCQVQIIEQLRKQLGLDEQNHLETKERSVPIRIAFTYDKDDYENKFTEGTNPFHDRLTKNGIPINDFAAELDNLFSIYTKEFDNIHELRDSLRLKGVMDVSSIKGLTMPITIVLPSSTLLVADGKESEEDLSLYLVQITRAQYMNIILENTRKVDEEALISGIKEDKIEDWLRDILLNSAGFDFSLSSLFERTLEEFTSETLWDRLEDESELLEKDLATYIQWLRTLFGLIVDTEFQLTGEKMAAEYMGENQDSIIVNRNETDINKIRALLETYLLGDYLSPQNIAALKLFLTINGFLRVYNATEAIKDVDMKNAFKNWIHQIKMNNDSILDYDDELTLSWLELICRREIEVENKNNKVCVDLNALFDESYTSEVRILLPEIENEVRKHHNKEPQKFVEALNTLKGKISERHEANEFSLHTRDRLVSIINELPQKSPEELKAIAEINNYFELEASIDWPETPLPRLLMGPWRIKKPPKNDDSRLANVNPWMDEGSQFYNIHPDVLNHALIRGNDKLHSHAKIKLFLGVISQKGDIFRKGMQEVFEIDDIEFRHDIFNWYVDIFKERETKKTFKEDVSKKLEAMIKGNRERNITGEFQKKLTRFLRTATSIERFEQMIKAFNFKEWNRCAVVIDLFEQSIELTHKSVLNFSVSKQKPENPFKKGNNIYNFFAKHFSTKEGADEHKRWFDLLWGVEELLVAPNVFINSGEFLRHKLNFPTLNSKFGKKIHRCVNTFADVGLIELHEGIEIGRNVNNIFKRLQSAMKPEEDKEKTFVHHLWVDNLLEMLKSIDTAYKEADLTESEEKWKAYKEANLKESEKKWLTIMESGDGLPRQLAVMVEEETVNMEEKENKFPNLPRYGNLYKRLFVTLFARCKIELPKVMLSYALNMNQGRNDVDTIMGLSHLREYLASPQSRFVYTSITGEFISSENTIHSWKQIKGDIFEEGYRKSPFFDTLLENSRQREWNYRENEIPLTPINHASIILQRNRPRHQYPLKPEFVNAATFRALVQLSEEDLESASESFRDAGLLHHAAAVDLFMLHKGTNNQVKDLIRLVATLLKKEYNKFIDALYVRLPGEDDHTLYDDNRHYMFGIGPDKNNWNRKQALRFSMLQKLGFTLPTSRLDKDEDRGKIEFLIHSTRMEQCETLGKYLSWLEEETRKQSGYTDRWNEKISMHKEEFRMFFDYSERNQYSFHKLRWSHDETAHQPKPGFAPDNTEDWKKDVRILNKVNSFLAPFLKAASDDQLVNLDEIKTSKEWNSHVRQFTGVNGATLGYISPEKIDLPQPMDLEKLKKEHDALLVWFKREISKHVLVVNNDELNRYADKIQEAFEKKDFEKALHLVVYDLNRFIRDSSFGDFVNVHKELLKRVIAMFRLIDTERWNRSHFNPKNKEKPEMKVHSEVKDILDKSNDKPNI